MRPTTSVKRLANSPKPDYNDCPFRDFEGSTSKVVLQRRTSKNRTYKDELRREILQRLTTKPVLLGTSRGRLRRLCSKDGLQRIGLTKMNFGEDSPKTNYKACPFESFEGSASKVYLQRRTSKNKTCKDVLRREILQSPATTAVLLKAS
jgi:hypothetical protein